MNYYVIGKEDVVRSLKVAYTSAKIGFGLSFVFVFLPRLDRGKPALRWEAMTTLNACLVTVIDISKNTLTKCWEMFVTVVFSQSRHCNGWLRYEIQNGGKKKHARSRLAGEGQAETWNVGFIVNED